MSYRFVKITDYYPAFLSGVYEAAPSLSAVSYADQLQHLMAQGFGWADFFSRHLRARGVDAHEIVMNAETLQRTWALENGVPETAAMADILWRQLEVLNPEVLFFENPAAVSWAFLRSCRERLPNLRYLVGWCACPFSRESLFIFSRFDLMLTSGIRFTQDFSRKGLPVRLMRHGFEPSLLSGIPWGEEIKTTDIIFFGSFFSGKGFHDERWRFFKNLLLRGVNIALHTELPFERLSEIVAPDLLREFLRTHAGSEENGTSLDYDALADFLEANGQPVVAAVCRRICRPVFGRQMFAALAQARIGIHVHPDVSGEYTGGMRPFEVTGMGTCLLTDWKKDLPQLFTLGEEAVAFRSEEEAYSHIDSLLCKTELRCSITEAGQNRTCLVHSYQDRAAELAAHIDDLFTRRLRARTKFSLPPPGILSDEGKAFLLHNAPAVHSFLKRTKRWICG